MTDPVDDIDRSDSAEMGGTYTILLGLPEAAEIEVGVLGPRELYAGSYAYTGSALGPGGFARVDRHRAVCAGEREVRHWHVDYLLGHDTAVVEGVVRSLGVDAECAVARTVLDAAGVGVPVAGFGASDCDCDSHLAFAAAPTPLKRAVANAHDRARNVGK